MLRRNPLAAAALVLGAALVVVGVAGPPMLSSFDHLLLILAGIVLLPIGLVGVLRRPGPPPVVPTPAPLRPPTLDAVPLAPPAAEPPPAVVPSPDGRTLADARMDRWGAVVGSGSLRFPADPGGRFRPSALTSVQLVVADQGSVTLVACRTERDPSTGYLVVHDDGPPLTLVGAGADALTHALRFPPKAPTSFALDSTARLGHGDGDKQPLSDLRMRIESVDGGLELQLSARLHSAAWNRPGSMEVDAWPEEEPGRLELAFVLDAVTRVLRFSGYAAEVGRGRPVPTGPQRPSTAGTVRLGSTPAGFTGTLYGIDPDGGLVSISEWLFAVEPSITFCAPPRTAHRLPSGFVESDNSWPRVVLRGIDLGVVVAGLAWGGRRSIALTGPSVGEVEYSGGGSDGPGDSAPVRSARLDAEIANDGLRLHVHAEPDGRPPQELRMVLPWEVVVLRTGLLRRAQQRFVDGDAIRRGAGGVS